MSAAETLRALLAGATPGEARHEPIPFPRPSEYNQPGIVRGGIWRASVTSALGEGHAQEIASLIAAAVTSLPALLAVAEAAGELARTLPCIDLAPAGCGECLVCRLDRALAALEPPRP